MESKCWTERERHQSRGEGDLARVRVLVCEVARSWGPIGKEVSGQGGRIPHERRAHVQVEAHSMAKGNEGAWVLEGGAHQQEGGSHVCEGERVWGPHEVRCPHQKGAQEVGGGPT